MGNSQLWYPLDHAGKMYSSLVSSRATTLFRVSATLTKEIDPTLMQEALEVTLERFPFFKVQLRQGFFWYYLEGTNKMPIVEPERYYPCMSLSIKSRGSFPFRILYFNKRISVELSHSITDGTGGLLFLQELLLQYLSRKESVPYTKEKLTIEQIQLETENSFLKYYEKSIPTFKSRTGKSFKLPLHLDSKGNYYITNGVINLEKIKESASKFGTSINIFLTAIYMESLLKIQAETSRKKQPIVVNVPVNLRSYFKSKTMRNFFISISPTIDARLGDYELAEIIEELKIEYQRLLTAKRIKQHIKRSVIGETSLWLRLMPSFVKDIIAPSIYSYFGESQYTSGLSNMGMVKFPQEIEQYIERFDCYPPPSIGNIVKAVMVSYKENLHISFGNLSKDRILEREFFRRIRSLGINVAIETNDEEN